MTILFLLQQSAVPASIPPTTTGPSQPPPQQTRLPHVHGPPPPHPYYQHHHPHGYSPYAVPYFRPPVMMGTGGALQLHSQPILPPPGGQAQLSAPVPPHAGGQVQLAAPVQHASLATQGNQLSSLNYITTVIAVASGFSGEGRIGLLAVWLCANMNGNEISTFPQWRAQAMTRIHCHALILANAKEKRFNSNYPAKHEGLVEERAQTSGEMAV